MAFKKVLDTDTDVTISLGGNNKKTGVANPKSIEGYYLGSRTVPDNKKKSGVSYIYAFQTPKGNVGVWGKTDLDRKMGQVALGAMTRITHTGFRDTPNGQMYIYSAEVDLDNRIDVGGGTGEEAGNAADAGGAYGDEEESSLDGEETAADEAPVQYRAQAPKKGAVVNSNSAKRVQELLNGARKNG